VEKFNAVPVSETLTTGITKTVMGEMLDTTNRQEGFALLHVVWPLGASIA
jgi:hypothetical protein